MILSSLVINSSYAQNYSSSSNNDNSTSNNNNDYNSNNLEITRNYTTTKTLSSSSLSYKFEPFLLLDGTTFKDIPNNDTLTLNDFAIAAWINTNQSTLSESSLLVNKGGFNSEEEGDNMNYGIWFSKNGNVQGGFETKSGENFEVNSTAKYNDGKWHFILLSYNGSVLKLYIDGKQISTKNTNGAIPDSTGKEPLRIGANSLENDKYFTGYIDEVRVWNRGLTNEETSQIYTNNTFNSKGQVVYLDFKNNDSNSNSNDISNSNKSNNIISNNTSSIVSLYTNETSEIDNINNFNIAVAADWGCGDSAKKTVQNMQKKNPEIVIANGDLSYEKSSKCWFEIIKPLKSKIKIAMGDHEYSDTNGGAVDIVNQYLKPLNLENTYYSFDINNVHVTIIDPSIDYGSTSDQYRFIENDLKAASTNPNIDWIFAVQSTPLYTSPSMHPANSTIRDVFHPLFDRYSVDLVFSSDNHNYQRTFPLKYNNNADSSDNPIISDRNQINYYEDYQGQIYFITGTAGRSHYEIKEQAPFVAKQDDEHFGFLNIDIDGKTLKGIFYANENELPNSYYVDYQNNIIDEFTISEVGINNK